MGNCCSTNGVPHSHLEYQSEEEWYSGNENFDFIRYHKSVESGEDASFHKILTLTWRRISLPDSQDMNISKFNNEAFMRLRHYIHKGVPNLLTRDVVSKIILFDDENARVTYTGLLECIELPDLVSIPPTLDPLFGRKTLNNCLLSGKGFLSCKRLLFVIKNTITEIEVCLLLPRFVQMLLWFFREYEVYTIVTIILSESLERKDCHKFTYHFPLTLRSHKQIAATIVDLFKDQVDSSQEKGLKTLVKDIVFNMLIGYISPSLYSTMLCYFISDGMSGIMKLTVSLLRQLLERTKHLLGRDLMIDEFKSISIRSVNYLRLIKDANKIRLGARDPAPAGSSVNTMPEFFNYQPPFDGNSLVLNTKKKIEDLCGVIPKHFLSQKIRLSFSLFDSGHHCDAFVERINQVLGAFIVLVETKGEVLGLFVDRAVKEMKGEVNSCSRIIRVDPNPNYACHVIGCPISITLDDGFAMKDANG